MSSKKHTLDSDEEDNVVEEETLQDSDIEGQEDTAVDIEEGIRFTPFHMREELAEGHFDVDGMYIFNKNIDEIADKWIEEVNWSEMRNTEALLKRKRKKEEERLVAEASEETLDVDATKEKMLLLMQPGETVLSAIKRLGNKTNNLPAWKKKKLGTMKDESLPDLSENSGGDKLDELIGYADKLLLDGVTSIYSDTFEKIMFQLAKKQKGDEKTPFENSVDERPGGVDGVVGEPPAIAIDEVDIFGDIIPADVVKKKSELKKNTDLNLGSDEITWEFKWENKEDSELHGPYSTGQMQRWVDEEYFKEGVFVRKCHHADTQFYTSRRIDFSLFL